jgi:hypothetical protein
MTTTTTKTTAAAQLRCKWGVLAALDRSTGPSLIGEFFLFKYQYYLYYIILKSEKMTSQNKLL